MSMLRWLPLYQLHAHRGSVNTQTAVSANVTLVWSGCSSGDQLSKFAATKGGLNATTVTGCMQFPSDSA